MRTRVAVGCTALLAVLGVAFVVVHSSDDDPPKGQQRVSAEALCRADLTTRFDVSAPDQDDDTVAATTAIEAVAPWTDGKDKLTVTDAGDQRYVTVARSDDVPQVVLVLAQSAQGWSVDETIACLSLHGAPPACTYDTVDFHMRRYHRVKDIGTVEPGQAYGQIEGRNCIAVHGKAGVPRGPIRPITAYSSADQDGKDAIVVTQDGESHLYEVS